MADPTMRTPEAEAMWKRIATSERHQDGFDLRLQHVEKTTDKISANIDLMMERLNQRGDPISWRQVGATVVLLAAVGVAVWQWVTWSVENAPITRDVLTRIIAIESARRSDATSLASVSANRHTAQDELVSCLRAEILNRDIGWRCANPGRGVPHNDVRTWRPRVSAPRS